MGRTVVPNEQRRAEAAEGLASWAPDKGGPNRGLLKGKMILLGKCTYSTAHPPPPLSLRGPRG